MKEEISCPRCRYSWSVYKNPVPTVDIIIRYQQGIVLIERQHYPFGWAIPGGFVDYGESLEAAAVREAKEETSLDVVLEGQFHCYSDPQRDPRQHTISTVFIGRGYGVLQAADDAVAAQVFGQHILPVPLAFDHGTIIHDYFASRWAAG
ncbi:MAG: NUDIX hydrolase [Deltaproteobacteria bacterium]|nr:NUDIX hydrolase [Candidatus Anaeroferrophillus wilburensis]MBN2888201.1 NUDIX hydrolase [Deltaproteobacteria bacterium]